MCSVVSGLVANALAGTMLSYDADGGGDRVLRKVNRSPAD